MRARIAVLLSFAVFLFAPSRADGRITRIAIATIESPTFEGRSFGDVGQYERLVGTVSGEVNPNDPLNAGIVNVNRAPRNARGMVEYSVDVDILRPVDPSRGNHHIYYDVNNRGNKLAVSFVNDGGGGNNPRLAADAGNGFLMNEGYTLVWSGWQGDVAPGGGRVTARFPIATNLDGSPIVAMNRDEFIFENLTNPATANLSYPAATLDPTQARLTVRQNEMDPRQTPAGLSWSDVSDRQIRINRPAGFDAGAIYEFIYPAKDPIVMGLGFAATRDVISFLRYEAADDLGAPNPLAAGGLPAKVLVIGISQSGRFLRDLIYQGFNQDERGRQVIDGANPVIAGSRKTFTNFAFAQPGRFSRQHEDHTMPGDQFPFTYRTLTDPISGRTDGILARCTATGTCPKVVHTDSDSEMWQARGSLVVTDTQGRHVTLPDNVRVFLFAGSQHGPAAAPARGICQQLNNPLPYSAHLRALTRALDGWVTAGRQPPASRYPNMAEGTLAPPLANGFPSIPGVNYNGRLNTLQLNDYSTQPPTQGALYPVFVNRVDADGNGIGGVRHPSLSVPLATYGGWSQRAVGFAPGEVCNLNGSYVPFKATAAERIASGDPRLSVEERYRNHGAYVSRIARAAARLVQERLLLDEDAQRIVDAASESAIGK